MIDIQMKTNEEVFIDRYLEEREFLPSQMDELVEGELKRRGEGTPAQYTKKELKMKWELLLYHRKTKRLRICRCVLAAACVFLTVGLAASFLHPVKVQGSSPYVTFITGEGRSENYRINYKEIDPSYGRTYAYKSWRELEAGLGFSLVKPEGQEVTRLYLDSRPGSSFYNVAAYFDKEEHPVFSSYNAYFVKEEEEAYGYSYSVSQDWVYLRREDLGGRTVTLYRLNGTAGGKEIYGAAFSEDGFLYVLTSGDSSLETFKTALSALVK